jgi:hypothetical protein
MFEKVEAMLAEHTCDRCGYVGQYFNVAKAQRKASGKKTQLWCLECSKVDLVNRVRNLEAKLKSRPGSAIVFRDLEAAKKKLAARDRNYKRKAVKTDGRRALLKISMMNATIAK